MNNHEHLVAAILPLSTSETWELAKLEWDLVGVSLEDDPETCPCTHYPIFELCQLHNRENGNEIVVGNVCVSKFLGLPSAKIFAAIKRIAKDPSKSLGSAVGFFYKAKVISQWEYGFLVDTGRKRRLTERQWVKRIEINTRLLTRMGVKIKEPSTPATV